MTASITREAALRLGMAARELGGVSLNGFVQAVGDKIGLPLTETRLSTITVTDLREILAGNHAEEDCKVGVEPDTLKKVVRLLVRLEGSGVRFDPILYRFANLLANFFFVLTVYLKQAWDVPEVPYVSINY